jgi:hypothetical protein
VPNARRPKHTPAPLPSILHARAAGKLKTTERLGTPKAKPREARPRGGVALWLCGPKGEGERADCPTRPSGSPNGGATPDQGKRWNDAPAKVGRVIKPSEVLHFSLMS